MLSSDRARIIGAWEHSSRHLPDHTITQIHAEVAAGALQDAGMTLRDVDGYACAGEPDGFGAISMAEYLGLDCKWIDSTETGGSSYVFHVNHAAAAIAAGLCRVVLITLAGKPRSGGSGPGATRRLTGAPEYAFEHFYSATTPSLYALAARRHMHEFGTTSAQLAEVKVAAAHHAQFNEHALLRTPVSIDDVLGSPMVADPLHRLDCCVITDGGGAIVVAAPEVARASGRRGAEILGCGEAIKHNGQGNIDLTWTAAAVSGPAAFESSGLRPSDVDYASIYDSFTITVVEAIEDLGFCPKGEGGAFVSGGALQAPDGALPFNTDGGGLCSNHPGNRGGMTKMIAAVRQLRGEAHPAVQVPNCDIALVHATGGSIASRMGSATLLLGSTS